MDPTSPFSPSPLRAVVEPEDIPLPEIPATENAPSATAAVLASSSTVPATEPNIFLTHFHHFLATLTELVSPAPVRTCWQYLYTTLNTTISSCPTKYRCGIILLAISIGAAEWQQPGSFPRPHHLTNAIIGLLCATIMVLGILALIEYTETNTWPWHAEGWIWPWEKWLWRDTVYDLGASTSVGGDGLVSPPSAQSSSFAMPVVKMPPPPPTAFKRPIFIPPTPYLPAGMRPPPTPAAHIHRSGIIGESPAPAKTRHSTGNAFADRYARLQEVSEWHAGVGRVPGADGLTKRDAWEKRDVKGKGKIVEEVENVTEGSFREGSLDLLAVPELMPDI